MHHEAAERYLSRMSLYFLMPHASRYTQRESSFFSCILESLTKQQSADL